MRHARFQMLLLAPLLVVVTACDADGGDDATRRGGTVVIAAGNDLGRLNALVASEKSTMDIMQYGLFLPLVSLDADMEYEPALARAWEWEGDTAVVFDLHRDVRWHDGERTTAEDVAFTLERARDPATGFANPEYFDAFTSVEAVDSFTVRITFRPRPDPLVGLASTPVMPRHLLDSIPAGELQNAAFNQAPVGNGPFRFVSRRANDRVVLEANPDFPAELGGRPRLDRVIWQVIPEASAQVVALRTGEVDMALGVRADQVVALDTTPELRGIVAPSWEYHFIGWNGQVPALSDARVRRALTMAMDRDGMLHALRAGYGELTSTPVDPSHWAYDPAAEPLPYDTAAARELLAEAGYENRDQDPWLEGEDGQELAITLKIPANSEYNRDVAELVRGDFQDIGVRLTAEATELGTLIQDISTTARDFEGVVLSLNAGPSLTLRDMFHSETMDGQFQLASYSDPRMDSILDSLATTVSRDDARPLWARLQRLVRDEQPWTYLWFAPQLVVVREDVNGIEVDARSPIVTLPDWWLDPSHPRAGEAAADTAAVAAPATD